MPTYLDLLPNELYQKIMTPLFTQCVELEIGQHTQSVVRRLCLRAAGGPDKDTHICFPRFLECQRSINILIDT